MTLKERILRLIDSNAKLTAPELAIMLGSSEEEVSTTTYPPGRKLLRAMPAMAR